MLGVWIRGYFFSAVGKVAGEQAKRERRDGRGSREGSRGRGGTFVKWNWESGVGTRAKYRVNEVGEKMGFVRLPIL